MFVLRFRRFGLSVAVLASALVVGAARLSSAQTPPSFPECSGAKASKDDVEAAKNAHRVATQFYDRADYDKAIQYWTDSYKFDCTANDLLINIANSYEKKGDRAATVATLEVYLKRAGSNPTIEEKVKNLKAAMASGSPAPSVTASAPPPVVTATPVAQPPLVPTAVPPPVAPSEERPYGAKPWFLVGGGGALAVVGAILLPLGNGAVTSAANACPNHVCSPAAASNISSGNTGRTEVGAGWGLLTVGVVAAAGGLVWQFLFNKPTQAPAATGSTGSASPLRDVWLAPSAAKGGAGPVGVSPTVTGLAAGASF